MTRFAAATATPITKLSSAFQTYVDAAAKAAPFGAPDKMAAVEAKLRDAVPPGAGLPDKYICHAVSAFRAKGADRLNGREVRALCAGLNHSCLACNTPPLMQAAPDAAHEIISRIARGFREKKLRTENWYDLLQSWLGSRERTVCCEMLRDLLAETFPLVSEGKGYPFAWLGALQANHAVLDKEPCRAAAGAPGDEGIEALRRALPVPDTSWFWRELTAARAARALELDDKGFVAALPGLLQAAHFLPAGSRDQLLRQFLERGAKCADPVAPEELKSFAVECWGAPPLGANPRYDALSPAARSLVQTSLAREDVKDFLTLLQPDERKLMFWSRYLKSVEFHRMLMGPEAQRAPQPAVAQLRSRPAAAKLVGAPDATSALVMKIGGWLVVESTAPESPLFGYRIGALPFKPGETEVELPCFQKGGKADFKLQRQDTLEGMWEDRLVTELATYGIRREEAAAKRKLAAAPAAQPQSAPPLDEAAFEALVRNMRLQAEDTRPEGGALWVAGDIANNYYLAQKLAGWGFRWKEGRGWWRY